jgi:ATP/maltotriose-dependent transcriptional regulator MalT
VFYDSYSAAKYRMSEDERDLEDAFDAMIRVGWARPDSTFRRVFTSLMIPGASEEQMRWLDDLQRVATSATTAQLARRQRMQADADELLPGLSLPTLVLHSVGDRMNSFEHGRHLAASIPGARLVALESENHILLDSEPAWPVFLDELRGFVAGEAAAAEPAGPAVQDVLSARELEVLQLVAAGCDNDEIAGRLQLSVRTVERHLQNVYNKLGVQGRSARVAAAARLLTPA